MEWQTLTEWSEDDWKELGRQRLHHPKCKKPEETIEEGRTARLTHGNSRVSWMDARGHFGHQCSTGLRTESKKHSGDKVAMEDALERVGREPDDEEAKRALASLTLKQLAAISVGRGAQQLRALELISDMAKVGMAPKVDDPEQCPVILGRQDCPVCGGRHQAAEIHVSDDLLRSLEQLDEIQAGRQEWPESRQ